MLEQKKICTFTKGICDIQSITLISGSYFPFDGINISIIKSSGIIQRKTVINHSFFN